MTPDEEMLEQPMPAMAEGEEGLEEEPMAEGEEGLSAEEEAPVEGSINLTVDEVPTLSEKAVGDVLSLEVRSVSEDGMSFELVPVIEEEAIEPGQGRAEIENAMLGG